MFSTVSFDSYPQFVAVLNELSQTDQCDCAVNKLNMKIPHCPDFSLYDTGFYTVLYYSVLHCTVLHCTTLCHTALITDGTDGLQLCEKAAAGIEGRI